MPIRTATRPAPTKRARVSQHASKHASHASHLSHHQRKCVICHHPERETIEEMFVHWHSASRIADRYMLRDRSTIYDHAHATGLFAKRRRNLRYALENVIERAGECDISSHGIVAAIKAHASLTTSGEWIEPARRIIYTSVVAPAANSHDTSRLGAPHSSPQPRANKNAISVYPQAPGIPYDPSDGWDARSAADSRSAGLSRHGSDASFTPIANSTSPANASTPVAAHAPQTTTHGAPASSHTATTDASFGSRKIQTVTVPQPRNSNRYTAGLKIPPTHTKQTPDPRSNRYK